MKNQEKKDQFDDQESKFIRQELFHHTDNVWKCMYPDCPKTISKSDANLQFNHYRLVHQKRYQEVLKQFKKYRTETLDAYLNKDQPDPREEYVKKLATLIVSKCVSFSFVEDIIFEECFGDKVSTDEISKTIKQMSEEVLEKQKAKYQNTHNYGTLLFDGWQTPQSQHLIAVLLKVKDAITLQDIIIVDDQQNAFWLAQGLKSVIDTVEKCNIHIIALACDNAPVNGAAIDLLNHSRSEYKKLTQEQIDSCAIKHSVVHIKCTSHSLDLVLKDYITYFNLENKIKHDLDQRGIQCRVIETRWNSYNQALKALYKNQVIPEEMQVHVNLINFLTATIDICQADKVKCAEFKEALDKLKKYINDQEKNSQNDECVVMKHYLAKRESQYLSFPLQVAQLHKYFQPNVPFEQDQFKSLCKSVFLELGIPTTRIISIGDHAKQLKEQEPDNIPLKDKFFDFPEVLTFFEMYDSIAISEAHVERLFSFFHRSMGMFLRKQLSIETLKHLGRVYLSVVVPYKLKHDEEILKFESYFE